MDQFARNFVLNYSIHTGKMQSAVGARLFNVASSKNNNWHYPHYNTKADTTRSGDIQFSFFGELS